MRSVIIAFSMYSRIPMPKLSWREKDMRYAICAFPLIGIVIAATELALVWAAQRYKIPSAATVSLMIALPILITGGIHLDGFIDTSDARSSYRSAEEKLAILKDPHVGAFGIIRLFLYFLIVFAGLTIFLSTGPEKALIRAAALLPVVSRSCSGLTAELMSKARKEGMLSGLLGENRKMPVIVILILWLAAALGAVFFFDLRGGGAIVVAESAVMLYYGWMVRKEFGGVTGDLAGWYLCTAEAAGVWAMAVRALFF